MEQPRSEGTPVSEDPSPHNPDTNNTNNNVHPTAPQNPSSATTPPERPDNAPQSEQPALTSTVPPTSTTTTAPTTTTTTTPTPEPDLGPRAARLKATFGAALSRTLATLDFPAFSACFPTPATYRPATLRAFWEQFRNRLGEVCLIEYENVVGDRDVVILLNRLDRLIGDAKARRTDAVVSAGGNAEDGDEEKVPIAPHTLTPHAILDAHLRPHLRATHKSLTRELDLSRAATTALAQQIRAQRAAMTDSVVLLERVVDDIRIAAGNGTHPQPQPGTTPTTTGLDDDLLRSPAPVTTQATDGHARAADDHDATDPDHDDSANDDRRKRQRTQETSPVGLASLSRLEVVTVQMEELVTTMSRP